MIVKWLARKNYWDGNCIVREEFVRESEHSVFDAENWRYAKKTNAAQYCDTWAEAHAFLVDYAYAEFGKAVSALEQAEKNLIAIKAMQPPR